MDFLKKCSYNISTWKEIEIICRNEKGEIVVKILKEIECSICDYFIAEGSEVEGRRNADGTVDAVLCIFCGEEMHVKPGEAE